MTAYREYQKNICEIPDFLRKYLSIDILKRLKDISLFCGMDYASKYIYDFKYPISRYDHSLNTALITWRLSHDITPTLAALFHDISTPVFSHVIDYMNGDYIKQESTECKTRDIILSSEELLDYLNEDKVDVEKVIDFKRYSLVDLPRPHLCADRVENLIGVGMSWANNVTLEDALSILSNLYVDLNEYDQLEISISNVFIGEYLIYVNNEINKLTHSSEDTYMMLLLSKIVKNTIDNGLITYDDLYNMTESYYVKLIESNLKQNEVLDDYWHQFKTIREPIVNPGIEVKNLEIDPLVLGRRHKKQG